MQIPRISDAEWEIMKVLWPDSKLTASEIIDALKTSKQWSPKTVRTLIRRLVDKGALGCRQDGKLYRFYPLVKEEECIKFETESFIQRIYGGALKPFLAHFLKDDKLSKEDIEELKKILEEREDRNP